MKVVIVGAGFGGLNAAKGLVNRSGVEVVLLDRRNHHLFQPLLYQVAMAALSPAEIAAPIRSILAGSRNIDIVQDTVHDIDLAAKTVQAEDGTYPYDRLILACGAQHTYFGNEHWEPFAPGLKTIEQATEMRRRVLSAFERAEREPDPRRQRACLTFVVVGGGPTGVELAGAIGEMSRFTLARDFSQIDPTLTRIILIEAGPTILPSFPGKLASRATRDLEKLGVQVWTNSMVTDIDADGVSVGNERIESRTVLWAAGVRASDLGTTLGGELDRQQRVVVEPDLSVPGHSDVFVIGDQCHFNTSDGKTLPGVAPVAVQQGRYVAKMILRDLMEEPRSPFRYLDKGQMATIGRTRAIVDTGRLTFAGLFAWLVWLVVHIYYLTGFRNKLFVLLNWAWSYISFRRGARLIVEKEWRSFPNASPPPPSVEAEKGQ